MTERSFSVEREYDAPVHRVFAAWTSPEQLRQWFHGSSSTRVRSAEADVRPGGHYHVEVVDDENEEFIVSGTYSIVNPPHCLEFTWQWKESSLEPAETLVRVDLEPLGEHRTRLRLTHTRFSSDRAAAAHDTGWSGVLNSLGNFVNERRQP